MIKGVSKNVTFFQIHQKWPKRKRTKKKLTDGGARSHEEQWMREFLSGSRSRVYSRSFPYSFPVVGFSGSLPISIQHLYVPVITEYLLFSTRVGLLQLFLFLFYHCVSDALVGGSR